MPAVEGQVRWYVRGGFNREVYDLQPIAPVTQHLLHWPLSLKIASQKWAYHDANVAKIWAKDPEAVAEFDRFQRLEDLLDRIEKSDEAGKVLIRLDKSASDGSADVVKIDFRP